MESLRTDGERQAKLLWHFGLKGKKRITEDTKQRFHTGSLTSGSESPLVFSACYDDIKSFFLILLQRNWWRSNLKRRLVFGNCTNVWTIWGNPHPYQSWSCRHIARRSDYLIILVFGSVVRLDRIDSRHESAVLRRGPKSAIHHVAILSRFFIYNWMGLFKRKYI